MHRLTKKHVDEVSYKIIGAAIEVHKHLGPGLLEKTYEACLIHELELMGLKVVRQQTIPIAYKGVVLHARLRYDLLVEDCVVVDNKAVSTLIPLFQAQIMTFMNLLQKPKGILINFNCTNIFREGQKTFVNKFYRALPDD